MTAEQQACDIVQKKLACLRNAVRDRSSWSHVIFPLHAGGIGTSMHQSLGRVFRAGSTQYSKKYMTKKLTKLQKIKQKEYQRGRSDERESFKHLEHMHDILHDELKSANKHLEVEKAKVASLSAILQSIHNTAQAGADILRIKS